MTRSSLPLPALVAACAGALASWPLATLAVDEDVGAPFGTLTLVDEVNAGDPADPHALYEDPAGGSRITQVLGRSARVMDIADGAKVFAYRLGAGKGLVAGGAYLLLVEYPEDTGRQIVVANRGGSVVRTLATGQTIGDSRESYTYPAPESLEYPLSGKWETYRSLFFLNDRFQGVKAARNSEDFAFDGGPADGFWVAIGQFRKKDTPLDAGAAVARIRLFAVPQPERFFLAPAVPLPSDLPKRRVFWREEMSDGAIGSSDPARREVSSSIDWFDHKMQLARFLGVNTYTKDLLEFGHCQHWDPAPGGGNDWYYSSNQPLLWEQIVARAKTYGLDVLPYYEYAGSIGAASYGKQRHCRPLGDRTNGAYTDIGWSEIACIDVSDPAALEDVKKLLDATIVRFKSQATFAGAWFRTRSSNWPISFADETLARFGAQANGGTVPTRDQLKADAALLEKYYGWFFEKRKAYLTAIRDHLRANANPESVVLFTSYIEEALHVPEYSDWATPTDDVASWDAINTTDPWKWRFGPVEWSKYVSEGRFLEMTTRMKPPKAETLANHWPEMDHSAPPADPARYQSLDGVFLVQPFSRLFTVTPDALEAFRAKDGLAVARHFCLNEEDGQNATAQEGPMSKKLGYFVTDVDRAGPHSMLAEARALANGDPRFVGYLSSSSFSRGFPEVVRAFNAAFTALPALASTVVPGAAADAEVVVRRIDTQAHGTYFAVVNTGLASKTGVKVALPVAGAARDLVTGSGVPRDGSGAVAVSLYSGQVLALNVSASEPAADAGADPSLDSGGSPATDGSAPAVDSGFSPTDGGPAVAADGGALGPATSGCACQAAGASPWSFLLLACGAVAGRRLLRRGSRR